MPGSTTPLGPCWWKEEGEGGRGVKKGKRRKRMQREGVGGWEAARKDKGDEEKNGDMG